MSVKTRPLYWLLLCTALLALLASGCGPSVVELDNEQGQFDQAAPLPEGEHTIGQSFVSHFPGLTAVEVLLVVHDEPQPAPSRRLTFHLRSSPYTQTDLATLPVDTASLRHNDVYRFTFPPQPDSEGREYFFLLEASEGNKVTVWQNSRNAYGEGTMFVDGGAAPGDLLFKTYYDFDLTASLSHLARGLASHLGTALTLLALLLAPGYLLCSLLVPDSGLEPLERLAVIVGLSLALIPTALLVTTTLKLRLNTFWARALLGALVVAALWRIWGQRGSNRQTGRVPGSPLRSSSSAAVLAAFGAVFAVTLALRFLHSRTLVLPAWVDSVHHTMIVQLIMAAGRLPDSFRPFMPIDSFFVHFGFHSIAATAAWLTGLDAPAAVLATGQVLNALMALSLALLTSYLTRRAWAGVVAALTVGTLSMMPAFYLSWGRYTQLTGLVLLPTALVLTLDALRPPRLGEHANDSSPVRPVLVASVAVAGLLLTHYRVGFFYAAFIVVHLGVATWLYRGSGDNLRAVWLQAMAVAFLSLVLMLPWLINMLSLWTGNAILGGEWQGTNSYNVVPRELLWVGKNRALAALAGIGLLWALLRREQSVITLYVACGLLVALANPGVIGLSSTWLLNNAALVIAFFVPLSFGVGCVVGWALDLIRSRLKRSWHPVLGWAVAAAVGGVALWGAGDMLVVINPVTVLASRDDLAAMEWIRHNIPAEAKFLVNARHWQEGVYMGTDGGYWIHLLTGRQTTLPPALYFYGSSEYIAKISKVAEIVATATTADSDALHDMIETEGVTHVYLGARGGALRPDFFADDSRYRTLYSAGSVWIFERASTR